MVKGEMKQITDDELVEQYRNGGAEAFDQLLERYGKPLYNFIFRMLGNKAQSEDVLQEVFLRVIRNVQRYEMKGKFKSWLFTIANHLAISELRHSSKRKSLSLDQGISTDEGEVRLGDMVGDERYLPDVMVERKELREKLDEAIQLLPVEQRQVLMMRHFSELSFKEIADAVGCPINTALGRMYYALKNMRKKLKESY